VAFRRIIPVLLLLLILVSASYAEQPRYLEITFLSTNDLHAHVVPIDIKGDPVRKTPDIKNIGGMARIATVIKQVRAETQTPVLLFDSGDTTHGYTALPKAFHGASTIAVMNSLKYDAMVPGNHDFQWHATDALRNKADSEFPWLCADITYPDGKLYGEPYTILDVGGVRVAVLGLTINWPVTQPNVYLTGADLELKYLDATGVAAKMVAELRQKADVVVVLSHLGYGADQALAKAVPGIDVILGGHSHYRLTSPKMIASGQPGVFSLGMVPIVQAGYYGMDVGRTRLIFHRDDSGKYTLMSCKGELVRINASVPDDPETAKLIKEWQKRIPPPQTPKK
jgi:5'-nucleotidase/UDP-sugar diphosphatase